MEQKGGGCVWEQAKGGVKILGAFGLSRKEAGAFGWVRKEAGEFG